MRNRFKDALLAQGASNPGALCRSLAEIQTELYAQGMGTDAVRADPACRLIAYQISYLFNSEELMNYPSEYHKAVEMCEAQIEVA